MMSIPSGLSGQVSPVDVREAIEHGLLNDPLAEGSIDPDEDDAVLPQFDTMIHAQGEHALVKGLSSPEDESQSSSVGSRSRATTGS